MRRIVLLILIVLTCLFLPQSCGSVLLLVNSVNPMQLVFITSFTVQNASGQPIDITPVGTRGSEGKKSLLPIFTTASPAFPAIKTRHFHIENGDSIAIRYDWDDVNFSEIVVRTSENHYHQLVVDPTPTDNQYHPPTSDHFVIPPISQLQPIDSPVLAAVQTSSKTHRLRMTWLGLLSPLLLLCFLRLYRRQKGITQPPHPPDLCQ